MPPDEAPRLCRGPRRAAKPRCFLLMVITITFAAAHVRAETFGNITVSSDSPFTEQYQHGYGEVRFAIINRSPDREHVVGITLDGGRYGNSDHLRQLHREVRVSPGTSASISLYMPPLHSSLGGSTMAAVTIDGRRQRDGVHCNTPNYQGMRGYWGASGSRVVLASRGVGGTFRDGVVRQINGGAASHSGGTAEVIDGPDTASWSTSWLGYSRFDGVVLTADELRRAPEQVRAALWRYSEAGGVLTVLGDVDVPRPWNASPQTHADVRRHHVGFGIALVVPRGHTALNAWDQATWRGLDAHWQQTAAPLNESLSLSDANSRFRVVESLTLPVRSMLALMIVFAVVIGPVNLVVLTRKGKAIWMLWTVPALAVLTSAGVFGYSMVVEGWNAHSRIAAVTLLDEVNERATTLGWIGFYAPLTPGDGLRFDASTELMPQLSTDWNSGGTSRDMSWTAGQHLQGGWVSARVPAFFKLRKSEHAEIRVPVSRREDGELVAVNGLGVPIVKLYVAGPDNWLYLAENVEAGASVTLKQHSAQLVDRDEPREIFTADWIVPTNREDFDTMVPPDGYVAVIDGSPFVEPGLAHVKSSRQRTVVVGILKAP